jgi:hypothetical protein
MKPLLFSNHPQGSEGWHKDRLGVITASKAHALLLDARSKAPKYKEARNTYMNELIAEVCTGHFENLDTFALQWGRDNEEAAISAFEFETGLEIEKIGLAYKDDSKRAGASADFKVKNKMAGGENKCPLNPKYHIDFIFEDEIKPEYITQMQFGLWVTGWDEWYFTSYQPKMKKKNIQFKRIEKNEELMRYFDEEVPKFIYEMDKKLEIIGIPWASQWGV